MSLDSWLELSNRELGLTLSGMEQGSHLMGGNWLGIGEGLAHGCFDAILSLKKVTFLMLCFVLFGAAVRDIECRKCKGRDFRDIKECHKTGYVKGQQSCTPELAQTYGEAAGLTVVLVILAVNFLLLAKIRRAFLVAKMRKPDAL